MLKLSLSKMAIIAALTSIASVNAQAEMIDFEGIPGTSLPDGVANARYHMTYLPLGISHVAGYTFTTPDTHSYESAEWVDIFAGGLHGYTSNNGTDIFHAEHQVQISRTDGRSFDLHGLDLDNYYDGWDNPPKGSFVISATLVSGGKVSTVVTLDNAPNERNHPDTAFNHFSLTGFTNLTSLQISRQDDGRAWTDLSLDNLDVSVSAVPEPSTWAMLSVGLAGLLLRRRQRNA